MGTQIIIISKTGVYKLLIYHKKYWFLVIYYKDINLENQLRISYECCARNTQSINYL